MEIYEIKLRYKDLIDLGYEIEKIWANDYLFKIKQNIVMEIEDVTNKLDIVLQGKYNDKVLFISEYYLQLDFINNIIISCWEDDTLPEIKDKKELKLSKIKYQKNLVMEIEIIK